MKILLKAMETEEDLTRFTNFCEAHNIGAMARSNGRLPGCPTRDLYEESRFPGD